MLRFIPRLYPLRYTILLSYSCGVIAAPRPTLSETLTCAFETYADRPLLCYYDKERNSLGEWLTYAQFRRIALRIGSFLADNYGLKIGDRVGICYPNSTDWFLIEHACALRGFVSVSLPFNRYTPLVQYVQGFDIKALFVDQNLSLSVHDEVNGGTVALLADACKWGSSKPIRDEKLPSLSDELLYTIILTSGSTGKPKGVKYTRRMWNQDMVAYPSPKLRTLSYLPMSHIVDRHHASVTMFNGGEIVVLDNVESAMHALDVVSPTVMFTTPALCAELLRAPSFGSDLHTLICVTGTIQPDIAKRLKEKGSINIVNPYGLTDVGNIAVDGVLLDYIEYKVLPWERPASVSSLVEYGELLVRSHFEGYENSSQVAVDEDGFFRTGDIVEVDSRRRIKVVGRTGERVKLPNGEWLVPSFLEAAIEGDVECFAVLSDVFVTVGPRLERALAIVHMRSGYDKLEKSAVLKAINTALLRHGFITIADVIISKVSFTQDNNLRNHSLKLNRAALQQKFAKELELLDRPDTSKSGSDPVDITVRYLADVNDLPTNVSFRSLGGDSLKALEVKFQLAKIYNFADSRLVGLLLHNTYTLSEVKQVLRPGRKPQKYDSQTFIEEVRLRLRLRSREEEWSGETTILVTGANGHIGKHIINELFRIKALNTGTKVNVVCLVRSPSRYRDLESTGSLSGSSKECTVLYGDISIRNLGLSDEDYVSLTRSVTHIIHAAGNTNQALSCSDLSGNVTGLSEVLLLAASSSNLEAVTVLSSTDVLPNGTPEVFPLPTPALPTLNGYAQAKLQEEKVIADSVGVGMSGIIICRIGLVCNAVNGHDIDIKKDFIDILFEGIAGANATPLIDGDILVPKLVPVDTVSNWIVGLTMNASKGSIDRKVKVYHLINTDEEQVTYREIFRDMPFPTIPYETWVSMLPVSSALRRLAQFSNIFQNDSVCRRIVDVATRAELVKMSAEGYMISKPPRVRDIIEKLCYW